MTPTRSDFLVALLRSFAIQGSWNYRTLIGGGLAFALSPLLERIHAGDPVALRRAIERHAAPFNAHPYLSPVAIGALARAEQEGADAETLERFRTALRSPLGAIGDRAVWAGWLPFCSLTAIILYLLGLDGRAAAAAFLLVYNAGHISLRVWGLRLGWRAGLHVGAALKGSPLRRIGGSLIPVNQGLTAIATVLLIAGVPGIEPRPLLGGLVACLGMGAFLLPSRAGVVALGVLFASCLAWLVG